MKGEEESKLGLTRRSAKPSYESNYHLHLPIARILIIAEVKTIQSMVGRGCRLSMYEERYSRAEIQHNTYSSGTSNFTFSSSTYFVYMSSVELSFRPELCACRHLHRSLSPILSMIVPLVLS